MKKIVIKALAFLVIFCALFLIIQNVLTYKANQNESIDYRYRLLQAAPEGSVDVVFIGSSPVYAGVTPMVIWEETGITSFNIAISANTAFGSYYDCRFALETQHPKAVVIDFCGLFQDRKVKDYHSRNTYESTYRKTAAVPSFSLKYELIHQLLADNPEEDPMMWYFPLLRYHTRWTSLTESDFKDPDYDEWRKGALLQTDVIENPVDYDAALFDTAYSPAEVSEYAWGYYQKIIELCRENDVTLVAVTYPKTTTEELLCQYAAIQELCKESGVPFYNFNLPAYWRQLGLDRAADFYDTGHMNLRGSIKLSTALGELLRQEFDLPDHRGDEAYDSWDADWDAFYANYGEYLADFGY